MQGLLNNYVRVYLIKLKIGMLYHRNNTFRNMVFQIYVNVPLTYSINLLNKITLVNTCSVILQDIAAEIHYIFIDAQQQYHTIDAQQQYHTIDAQQQYHTKIYYTISGFLVWAASQLLWTKRSISSSVSNHINPTSIRIIFFFFFFSLYSSSKKKISAEQKS